MSEIKKYNRATQVRHETFKGNLPISDSDDSSDHPAVYLDVATDAISFNSNIAASLTEMIISAGASVTDAYPRMRNYLRAIIESPQGCIMDKFAIASEVQQLLQSNGIAWNMASYAEQTVQEIITTERQRDAEGQ